MSDRFSICCGSPVTCISTHACLNRIEYLQTMVNTDKSSVQSSINAVTHGSADLLAESEPAYRARMGMTEVDPNGLAKNVPGAKLDAGKVRVGLVLSGFARALMEVAKVGTAGANKYTPNGWMEVPNGIERYTDARDRHQLKEYIGEEIDPDFGLLHAAHECWNSLARLDLILRAKEQVVS